MKHEPQKLWDQLLAAELCCSMTHYTLFPGLRWGKGVRLSANSRNQKNRNISRNDAKHVLSAVEGAVRCHFERREKSFLDPSLLLGMTGHARHLAPLRLGGRNIRIREPSTSGIFKRHAMKNMLGLVFG